jgi:hypothetical protein
MTIETLTIYYDHDAHEQSIRHLVHILQDYPIISHEYSIYQYSTETAIGRIHKHAHACSACQQSYTVGLPIPYVGKHRNEGVGTQTKESAKAY